MIVNKVFKSFDIIIIKLMIIMWNKIDEQKIDINSWCTLCLLIWLNWHWKQWSMYVFNFLNRRKIKRNSMIR